MHSMIALALSFAMPSSLIEDGAAVGKRVASFKLQDYRGAWRSLDDFNNSKLIVVAFLGNECPLAKAYAPRLVELEAEYRSKGVSFLGINSNQQDTPTEIAAYARVHKIEFPVLKDPGNVVADQFGAKRTPEVFLLDQDRSIRYRGRVDDQYGIGFSRPKPTRHDLAVAIDELLAGKPVSQPSFASEGCHIGRVQRPIASGNVTYSNQISRILQTNCVTCHRPGEIAPFSLTSFEEVVGWAETIREVVRDERMPPWHANPEFGKFSNDSRLSPEEKQLISDWVKNGAPAGDPKELPPPVEFVEGWKIPKPDVVITMPRAYAVPATGVVDYQYFTVDPGFKEDVWVRASEVRAGAKSVVHHGVVFVQPAGGPNVAREGGFGFNMIAAFAPGTPPQVFPEGHAKLIPAGSHLVFQMHYTPDGTEQTDQTSVGLVLADPKTIQREVKSNAAINFMFRIPPGAKDHRVEAAFRFSQDTLLYTLLPHMHLRGKSFRFTAEYPDGATEVLLDVPRYDFAWQHLYQLAEPKLMPEGAKLRCVGVFDNSADNLSNPDPTKAVTFGLQTSEEMLVGYFDMGLASQDLTLGGPEIKPLENGEFDVQFRFRAPPGTKSVSLAGTFNDWKIDAQPMSGPDPNGTYVTKVRLQKGVYEYKFVVDGTTWRHDPGNRRQKGFYNNSVIQVSENTGR